MVWQWACFNHSIFWVFLFLFMLWNVYNRIISHKIFIFYLAKQSVHFKSLIFCSDVLALCLFFTHEKNRVNHERKLYLLGFCWQCKKSDGCWSPCCVCTGPMGTELWSKVLVMWKGCFVILSHWFPGKSRTQSDLDPDFLCSGSRLGPS